MASKPEPDSDSQYSSDYDDEHEDFDDEEDDDDHDYENPPVPSSSSSRQPAAQSLTRGVKIPLNEEERAPAKKSKKAKEINPLFKDVAETGKWGTVEKKELHMAVAFLFIVVVAVIVTVVVVVTGNKSSSPVAAPPSLAPAAPSATAPGGAPSAYIETTPEAQLSAIRNATQQYANLLPNSLDLLPSDDLFYYIDKWFDTSQPAQVRAASWMMYGDPRKESHASPWLVSRYALVVFYYSTLGEEWVLSTNWLTKSHTCTWYGVSCDRFDARMEELDLHANNLVGPLPDEIALFQNLIALTLFNNAISGTLPALQLGNMQKLTILSLQSNDLTGTVSDTVIENNALNTLFVQENNMTGFWPIAFCPPSGQPPVFTEFGLDCKKLPCICCLSLNNVDPCYD